eukprot:1792140-Rhodomonas_salina.1
MQYVEAMGEQYLERINQVSLRCLRSYVVSVPHIHNTIRYPSTAHTIAHGIRHTHPPIVPRSPYAKSGTDLVCCYQEFMKAG